MDCDKCGQKLPDEVVSVHISYIRKIQERAAKWDLLNNDLTQVDEWKEKAKRFDKIKDYLETG